LGFVSTSLPPELKLVGVDRLSFRNVVDPVAVLPPLHVVSHVMWADFTEPSAASLSVMLCPGWLVFPLSDAAEAAPGSRSSAPAVATPNTFARFSFMQSFYQRIGQPLSLLPAALRE
jgi:hypothetical protein